MLSSFKLTFPGLKALFIIKIEQLKGQQRFTCHLYTLTIPLAAHELAIKDVQDELHTYTKFVERPWRFSN